MAETLANNALCSLDDVLTYTDTEPDDFEEQDTLISLINAASTQILNTSGREFLPPSPNPSTRTFDLPYNSSGRLHIGDYTAITGLQITQIWTGISLYVLTTGQWTLYPRNKSSDEPYTSIRFDPRVPYLDGPDLLAVTANWGWPSVPEDVRQACRETVMVWFQKDTQHVTETWAEAASASGMPLVAPNPRSELRALPRRAYDIAHSYRREMVA